MTLQEKLSKHPFGPWTLALYGMTHTGKSSQCARVAKYIFDKSGLTTVWFLFDEGDMPGEADAGVAAGYIKVVDMRGVPFPFLTAKKISAGFVPEFNGKFDTEKMVAGGKFVPGIYTQVGLIVVDSGTAIADGMFRDLSEKSALGINVGGDGGGNFRDGDKEWGERSVGSSNRMHYNSVQTEMQGLIGRFKQMCARAGVMMIMTFAEDRGDTETTRVSFIGPKTKGSAQTTLLPGWFKFTYRMVSLPSGQNQEPKRVLWTERHKDGGIEALANRRFPILAPDQHKDFQPMFDPADVIKALTNYQKAVTLAGK
jgi:hypothetical protein